MFFEKNNNNQSSEETVNYTLIQKNNYQNESNSNKNDSKLKKSESILISDTPTNIGPPTRKHWKHDSEATACSSCSRPFTFINRRHHCRRCGDIFCSQCASYSFKLDRNCEFDSKGILSRVCRICYNNYQKELISMVKDSNTRYRGGNSRGNSSIYNREYTSYITPQRRPLSSSNTTANIPIIRNQQIKETAPATLMSVPSDWSWSTF